MLIGYGSDMSAGRTVERVIIVSFMWLAAAHAILDVSITRHKKRYRALNLRTIPITPYYETAAATVAAVLDMPREREYYICKTHKSFREVTAAMQLTYLKSTAPRKFLACFPASRYTSSLQTRIKIIIFGIE